MQKDYDKFTELNAEILTIAIDDFSSPELSARAGGYPFPMLYNKEGDVARAYGVYNLAGYANPAVFVVDANGAVVWQHLASAYNRTPNSDILAQLEKLN